METTKTATCPRCRRPLVPGALGGVELAICSGCEGVLVEQRRVIGLMEAMATELMDGIDLDHPLEAMADDGGRCECPRCGEALVSFGYLGTALVFPSRCRRCEVLWVDPGELGAMALLYARTERRVGDRREREVRARDALDERVHAMLKQRIVSRLLGRLI